MKTAYGKLATLTFLLVAALLLFAPKRSGIEDNLYAYPHSIRMSKGDAYDIAYVLTAGQPQTVSFSSADETVAQVSAQGQVSAVGPGRTQIRLDTPSGLRAAVQVEVVGEPAVSLSLNADSLAMEKGQITSLRAVFNEGAEETLVEWTSADPGVAQVDAIGRVSAVGGGSTRITASTPDGLSASADVSVHVTGSALRITPDALVVGTGSSLRLETYYLPLDTTDAIRGWSSSDASVLRAQDDGAISAVREGVAVVSAFSEDGLSASTVITVERPADRFDISPTAATIERGGTLRLEPRFMDARGETDEQASAHYVSWSSSNPDVASVSDGLVTALRSGTTRITASADGFSAVCELRVQVLIHEITLNLNEVNLLREQTQTPIQLEAAYRPADPDNPAITYSSDNPLVANVSDGGLVTMTGGYGTAIITARADSGAEARFTVNVVARLPWQEDMPEETGAEDAASDESATPEEESETE